jgi:CelD/BcsL family acetyltransferase involved in cellulose biosynthesis
MGRFSGRTRRKRVREARVLERRFSVRFTRLTEEAEVDEFLARAVEISKKTYQYNLIGMGLRDEDMLRVTFKALARRGLLRSYLLECDSEACCYIVGYQDATRFHVIDTGYDPAFAKHSVGRLLLLRVIEDLHTERPPELIDFGTGGKHKEYYATETEDQGDILLVRRRVYPRTVEIAHRIGQLFASGLKRILERFNLARRMKSK